MDTYFQSELRKLSSMIEDLAKTNPALASQLHLGDSHNRDPSVERLLQGVAYLTSGLQARLDNDIPAVYETLLQQLCKHLLRPFPSIVMVAPEINSDGVLDNVSINKEHSLSSDIKLTKESGLEDKTVVFKTTEHVDCMPIELIDMSDLSTRHGYSTLSLKFKTLGDIDLTDIDWCKLPIWVNSDGKYASELIYKLLRSPANISICISSFDRIIDNESLLTLENFFNGENLLSDCDESLKPCYQIFDFFSFQRKFHRFVINGLDKIKWPESSSSFELLIEFADQDNILHGFQRKHFKCFAIPAINILAKSSEPFAAKSTAWHHPLRVDDAHSDDYEIINIDSVFGQQDGNGVKKNYPCIFDDPHIKDCAYHWQIQSISANEDKHFIQLSHNQLPPKTYISVDLKVSQKNIPAENISNFDLENNSNEHVEFKLTNYSRPTKQLLPKANKRSGWELFSRLSSSLRHVSDIKELKSLLHQYQWTKDKTNDVKINGLLSMTNEASIGFIKGGLQRLLIYKITIDEKCFASRGEAWLLMHAILPYLKNSAGLNGTVILKMRFIQDDEEILIH